MNTQAQEINNMQPAVSRRMTAQVKPRMVEYRADLYCPICTHTVDGVVMATTAGKHVHAKPGQKCPRCSASLDAAYVMHMDRAA